MLCNFVRNISTNFSLWDNAHSLNLENCLLYLSSTISQFFDFVRCIVFDFIFYCVAVHTLYTGFVQVLENLESPGILLWHFPGLKSRGQRSLALERF